MNLPEIESAQRKLAAAKSVTVLTGAGISADSGVPTFRGEGGLWKQFRGEDLATPEAFQRHPEIVWEWYTWRRDLIAAKQPNAAHEALGCFEKRGPLFTLITQNVDGFHTLAGGRNVVELHGNIWKTRCVGCGRVSENRTAALKTSSSPLPTCAPCGALLRPHIVWFGEEIDPADLEKSATACREGEVMLVIGTSGVVEPAASFASLAKANGAFIIEINIAPSFGARPDALLLGRASDLVPKLLLDSVSK